MKIGLRFYQHYNGTKEIIINVFGWEVIINLKYNSEERKNILNEYQKIIIKSEPSLHLVTACEEKKLSTLSSSKNSPFIRDFKKLVTGLASDEKFN